MSKIASYLQEHISGEVSTNPYVLDAMSRDGSILQVKPEIVVYPRNTSDIRKIARFSWQLAERGHTLAITPRGGGSDQTGAAVGHGIVLSFPAHMNSIFEFEPRRKLVRVQPGAGSRALSEALWLHGASIPPLHKSTQQTVGGAVSNNAAGPLTGRYGRMGDWVDQLEVVLANGEVIQTGRLNKRELNKRKGLESLEGEIYRSLDNLIEDNKTLVEELANRSDYTNAGYASISSVKKRDGSFDLTPLFCGSQGTLGIISEMILKSNYTSNRLGVMLAVFKDDDTARDCIQHILRLEPSFVEYFDEELLHTAINAGKQFAFSKDMSSDVGAALLIGFDDAHDRKRHKKLKKAGKLLTSVGAWLKSAEGDDAGELASVQDVLMWSALPEKAGLSAPPLLDGIYIPPEQFSVFAAGVAALETKYHMKLPIYGRELSSLYYVWPVFDLRKTTDKQKALKLVDDFTLLVEKTGGELVGEAGEGRLKARFTERSFDDDTTALFKSVKTIFDPYGILNPGVKEVADLKHLAEMIRSDYQPSTLASGIPYV